MERARLQNEQFALEVHRLRHNAEYGARAVCTELLRPLGEAVEDPILLDVLVRVPSLLFLSPSFVDALSLTLLLTSAGLPFIMWHDSFLMFYDRTTQ